MVVLATAPETQEVVSVRDCPRIVGIKEYETKVWGMRISYTNKLVLSDGREVMSDLPVHIVRATMIGTDADTYCTIRLVPTKS